MKTQRFRHLSLVLALGSAAALTAAPQIAEACGGTFCDAGPTVMPVDQTGESILFWLDDGGAEPFTEAHIQIEYEGDPERFAWLIPVTSVPEIGVGSQAMFDNLLAGTVPTFTLQNTTVGDCFSADGFGCGAMFAAADSINQAGGDSGFGTAGDDAGDSGGVEILDRGLAGVFEYVTLTGGSVDEIVEWLDDNGYAQDDDAPPILEEYLAEDFVFVAIKLRSGTDSDEIHPMVVRYQGMEPCIPIRLTRIAAVEDMAIRAFFLGEKRVASSNWPMVEINEAQINWVGDIPGSYEQLVSLGVDEAGGRAFVTEYAGTDQIVTLDGILDDRWNSAAYAEIEAHEVVDVLGEQGLYDCTPDEWTGESNCYRHPQVEGLLSKYAPVPDGLDAETFYSCMICYQEDIDLVAWGQAPGFAADFEERILAPAEHGLDMLADATYLTRLYTRLSPHEMIEDPLFHETDLPTVDNNHTATRVTDCGDGPDYVELSDGTQIALDDFGNLPEFADMPYALRIERAPMMGPAQVEVDNEDAITKAIEDHNLTLLTGPEPGCSSTRVRPEGMLLFASLFGVAWVRRRRRQHQVA